MISKLIARLVPYLAAVTLALTGMQAFGAIATIDAANIQDNTVAEGDFPDNSSGACDSIFAGITDNDFARRALMRFDVGAQIPPGSIINSVTLTLTITRGGNNQDSTMQLHPLNAAWVEGTEGCGIRGGGQGEPSTGGVTWNNQPGFGASSGGAPVSGSNPVVWSTAAMVTDVQGWIDNPTSNYGWIVIGDEVNRAKTARRFDSSEGGSVPQLVVDFTPTGDTEACCDAATGNCSLTIVGSGDCAGDPQGINTTCEPNLCPQPVGACCNADRTCSDESRDVCEGAGGIFVGGNCNQADCGLTPFVEALPIPPVLQPTGTTPEGYPQYTVSVEEATQNVHPDLPNTTVWTYNGAWPSSTIVAVQDQPIEVIYQNNLPSGGGGNRGSNLLEVDTCAHGPNDWGDAKRISTHLHGGHLPARFDGQPEYTILPGETDTYRYPNNQEAGSLWYHDHALGITRLNVYGGMAGFYLLADAEDTLDANNAFGLPSGPYEIGLAIQDRTFNEDGSLFYNAQLEDAFKGEYVVVNGKVNPFLNVDQGKYRFRMLNGSQSREYIYRLENITDPGNDPSFTLVGTDVGLVSAPIDLDNSTAGVIGPAERLDVVIDFAGYPAGTEIILRNDDETLPLLPAIMKFIVTGNPGYTGAISSTLRTVTPLTEASADGTRYFRLEKLVNKACKDGSGRLVNEWVIQSLDGPDGNVTGEFWDDVTEFPRLGTREIWEFENPTSSYHPMHVHLVKFQILDKTDMTTGQPIPLQPWEANTWKDIVHIPPNVRARIIMDFEDYPGRFPNHCHLLDHEDHEMMRQFQATYDPANCDGDGICELGEDCVSCPGDCIPDLPMGQSVSGALCGNGLCEAGDGENCVTCAEDCGGRQKGGQQNQFCCGFDDGQVTNPIGCGVDANDNRCIDASADLACRVTARLSACCGDSLCEGQEEVQGNNPDTYCQVDCDPGPPPVCTRNAPTFGMGNDQSIAVDGSAVYTLDVTNNDTAACPDTTFDLSILSETGDTGSFSLPSVLSAASVTVAPGASDTSVTLTVTGNGTGANGDLLDSTMEARDDVDHAGQEQTDTVRTTIQAAVCTYSDPTVSISPNAQDITTDGGSVNYTVNVANNDTAACPDTTFNLSVNDTNGTDFVVPSTLGQNSLLLAPGANTDVTLTVAGQAGATNGATNGTEVATAADANHGIVTSNLVTTTINVGGGAVCEDITTKNVCNNTAGCEWQGSPQNGMCVSVGCTPDETPELSCFDGNDNDCDSLTDCADTADCEGSIGPATTCGLGVCESSGNLSCSGGSEVDNCTPLPATEPGTEVTCDNGLDDDCDGLTDGADPDCGGTVDCSQITTKNACNAEPTCTWDNRNKVCVAN